MKYYIGRGGKLYRVLTSGRIAIITDMESEEQVFCSADRYSIKMYMRLYRFKNITEEKVAKLLLMK